MKRLSSLLALCLALAAPAAAQVHGGGINGFVKDQQGGALPGASVTVQGVDASEAITAGSDGAFHFLDLAPGSYKITTALSGFATSVREGVIVEVGKAVEVPIAMSIAGPSETITVDAPSPIVNALPAGTAVNFRNDELNNIPTSRDPFALIRGVPGAFTDRVNVGGNETGQQLIVTAKGSRQQDTSWTLDGVEITDMAAPGQSAVYFNFDNFDEIHVSTAGNDIRERTGALSIDLTVKRGGNQYHGGVRGYYSDDAMQAANIPFELTNLATPVTNLRADRLTRNSDYGGDLGGPILRNRAWFYASYSTQNVQVFRRTSNAIDRTTLKDPNVKVNWQATSRDMVNFLYYNGYKIKDNRAPGATAFEQPAATYHQDNYYSSSPLHGLFKIADDHIVNSSLFVSAKYAYFNTGIALTPEGGMDAQAGINNVTTTSYGSFQRNISARPQHSATLDAHSFVHAFGVSHDVAFGAGYRTTDVATEQMWPGNAIKAIIQTATDLRAQAYREGNGSNRAKYLDFYVGDQIALKRLTVDLAVRYDRQWGHADASTSLPNPAFPDLLPGISFAGYDTPFTWRNWSPRVGLIYSLDQSRKTTARLTYSQFAGQLATTTVGYTNLTSNVGSITYRWADLNGDGFAQANEVNTAAQIGQPSGINPANPTAVVSASQIDPSLKAPVTRSIVAGLEREVLPNLAAQVSYTYSRSTNLFGNEATNITPRVGITLADYSPSVILTGTLPDGTPYSVQTYQPDPAKFTASGGGFVLKNVPGYYTDYNGVEVGLVKRMSNRWMGRLSVSYNNAREHFTDPAGKYDTNGNPTPTITEPLVDGGQFISATGTTTGNYYMNAKWQLNMNGMYLAPYGIELAANVFGRQGYPFPIFFSRPAVSATTESIKVLVTPRIDTFRYPNVWDTDARVARQFKYQNVTLKVMLDVFNLFNANTPLLRANDISSTSSFNALTQNMTPRVLRVGASIGF